MLSKKTTHVLEAINTLVEQFKNKPLIKSLVTAWVNQIQDIENMYYELRTERQLNNAVGVQLDGLGNIVGEKREGKDDDEYRNAIRVRILINKSNGTTENIYAVMKAFLNIDNVELKIIDYYPAGFIAEIVTILTSFISMQQLKSFIDDASPVAIKSQLTYHPTNPFRFDGPFGSGFDLAHYGSAI